MNVLVEESDRKETAACFLSASITVLKQKGALRSF